MEKLANINNEEWRKYYDIILSVMNEKFYGSGENIHTGYAYPTIRKSMDGKEEYYAFFISTSNVSYENGHNDYMRDMTEMFGEEHAHMLEYLSSDERHISLDDLAELNQQLKDAGAEKVYFQVNESYYSGQAALYNFVKTGEILLLIK